MFEAWRFAAAGLLIGPILIGGFVFGYNSRTEPVHWTVAFGTSPCLPPCGLFVLNILLAVAFIGLYGMYLEDTWKPDWFYFLTHWSITIEVVYFCLLPFVTWSAMQAQKVLPPYAAIEQPFIVSVTLALFHIQLPSSLLVTGIFWTLLRNFTKLCLINDDEMCEHLPGWLSISVHGADFLLCTISFLAGRIPFHRKNAGWFMFAGTLYLAWSLLHHLVLAAEEPLYAPLDWRRPPSTMKLYAIIAFVVYPVLIGAYMLLGKMRDCCCGLSAEPQQPLMMQPPNMMRVE